MQERLKEIRDYFHMTQAEFAKKLGIGQSTLAMMEVSKRDISDRHIKTICAICNVNEEWLRTGTGTMLFENDETIISEVAAQYHLGDLDRVIMKIFLELSPEKREAFKDFAFTLVDTVLNDDALYLEYQEYREDYIKENAGEVAARGGQSEKIDELKDLYDQRDGEKE